MPQEVDSFLQLRPRLREVRERDDGWIFALFDYDLNDAPGTALITKLHNDGVVSEIRREGQRVFPPNLGPSGTLALQIDTGKLPGFFETYDSLIKSNPDVSPDSFAVWEKNTAFQTGYAAACALLQFLKSKAEVWDTTGQRFFLVDQQAVEIPLTSYSSSQTEKLPAYLSAVIRFLDSGHLDADARWAFFRKGSLRLLRDMSKEKRLGILMENLGNILERAQQDHSLYLERFSFEDLLKNFDEKRLKFVGDLNQILASIQTALIAVPIGFFLIAEKFKATNGWVGQNIVIATGGILFFTMILILSFNQGQTLQGIQLALAEFEAEQSKKVTERSDRLQRLLATTWNQYRRVRCFLWAVRILLFLFSAVIVAALIWCSIPAWQRSLPYVAQDSIALPTKSAPLPSIATQRTTQSFDQQMPKMPDKTPRTSASPGGSVTN